MLSAIFLLNFFSFSVLEKSPGIKGLLYIYIFSFICRNPVQRAPPSSTLCSFYCVLWHLCYLSKANRVERNIIHSGSSTRKRRRHAEKAQNQLHFHSLMLLLVLGGKDFQIQSATEENKNQRRKLFKRQVQVLSTEAKQ